MYWYYRYPLIALLVLLAAGVLYMVWRSLPSGLTGAKTAPVAGLVTRIGTEPTAPVAAPSTDSGATAGSAGGTPEVLPAPAGAGGGLTPAPAAVPDRASAPAPVEPSPATPLPATPVTPAPGTAAAAAAAREADEAARSLQKARQQVEAFNYLAARHQATSVLTFPGVVEFDATWYAAAELVSRVNAVFMSSETANPERRAYTIKAGDSLSRIALSLNTTVGALQRLNGLDPTNPIIYPGNVLYALDVQWGIRVVKSKYVLLLLNGKDLYRLYRIGVGRENKTPVGTFTIASKVVHPAWTPPGRTFPYGHAENPLGTHWLGLTPSEGTDPTLTGYGIHGTWEPESIGGAASEGCVRLQNDQVRELFDFIPEPGRGPAVRVVIED
jgi:lipoprotein-anchoring transpeptidase ErfK/SrfK